MLGKAKPVQKQGQKMVVANFSNIHSKKLGFLAGFVIFKHSKSFSVSVWSPKGLFGFSSFSSQSQAFAFARFLGVSKSKINKALQNQLSLFN